MIRYFLVLFLFQMSAWVLFSQQDAQFSHYMFNNMAINPGYAGSKEEVSATLIHRQQWTGLEGAPTTSTVNIHAPFKLFNQNHGVGISIENDALGFNTNIGMQLAYAYRININNGAGKLGLGISGGFKNEALKATWKAVSGSSTEDSNIPGANESATTYNIDLGIFYKTDNIYFGVSTTHLTESKVKYTNTEVTLTRQYYITAGYNFVLANPAFEVLPSVLISSDATASKIDISSIVQYNKRLWGGLSFRPGSAITGLVGLELKNGIRIGYAYDFEFIKNVRNYNPSTHELMVSYGFSLYKEKIPHKYRSLRFL